MCTWPGTDAQMIAYHDTEWGVPLHDDQKLFEFMVLDAFQAGLSWKTILHRREGFRNAFAEYDVPTVAAYTQEQAEALMLDSGIIRNRLKIQSTIRNARLFMEVQEEFGSFDNYIWQFTNGRPLVNHHKSSSQIPATSAESDAMSKALLKRGFKFVGSTICYAFMQASGMINDHLISCPRHRELDLVI